MNKSVTGLCLVSVALTAMAPELASARDRGVDAGRDRGIELGVGGEIGIEVGVTDEPSIGPSMGVGIDLGHGNQLGADRPDLLGPRGLDVDVVGLDPAGPNLVGPNLVGPKGHDLVGPDLMRRTPTIAGPGLGGELGVGPELGIGVGPGIDISGPATPALGPVTYPTLGPTAGIGPSVGVGMAPGVGHGFGLDYVDVDVDAIQDDVNDLLSNVDHFFDDLDAIIDHPWVDVDPFINNDLAPGMNPIIRPDVIDVLPLGTEYGIGPEVGMGMEIGLDIRPDFGSPTDLGYDHPTTDLVGDRPRDGVWTPGVVVDPVDFDLVGFDRGPDLDLVDFGHPSLTDPDLIDFDPVGLDFDFVGPGRD